MNDASLLARLITLVPALGKKLLWLVPVFGVLVVVFWLGRERWQAEAAKKAQQTTGTRPPQPVRVVVAQSQPIKAWIFAEGTARAVRREYLAFERSGKVVYVRPGNDGGELRVGETVKKGEVIARLDTRFTKAEIDSALASLKEVQSSSQAVSAEVAQAKTQYQLTLTQYQRTYRLYNQNAAARQEYEEAKAKLENARAGVQAAKAKAAASQTTIKAAEARLRQAQVSLEEAEIVAPIDGLIAYLNVRKGFYFNQSYIKTSSEADALTTIPVVVLDPSEFEITVNIPAYEMSRIHRGQKVRLLSGGSRKSELQPDMTTSVSDMETDGWTWQAQGQVFSVNPAVNPGGRSFQVKIRTTQGAAHLHDGMFVTCWIEAEHKPAAVTVPFDVFLYEENRPYVFVVDPQKKVVQRRNVIFGIQGMQRREIIKGVLAGEQLVTDGRYRLGEGAPVRVLEVSK